MIKRLLFIFITVIACGNAVAQEFTETLTLYFRNADGVYDREYKSNGASAEEFFKNIERIQTLPDIKIKEIVTKGTTSPEGDVDFNRNLAEKRRLSFKEELHRHLDFPDYKIEVNPNPDCWNEVVKLIKSDPEISEKDTVLSIIHEGGNEMIDRLKALEEGSVYRYISDYIFPQLRTYQVAVTFDMSSYILPAEIPDLDEIERSLEFYEDGLDFVEFIYPEDVPFLDVERYDRRNYTVVADPIPREYDKKLKIYRAQKERRALREERRIAKGKVAKTKKDTDQTIKYLSEVDKYQNTPINAQTHPEKYKADAEPKKNSVISTAPSEMKAEKYQNTPIKSVPAETVTVKPDPADVKPVKISAAKTDRQFSIKTNLAGLAFSIANLGLEFDLSDRVSLNIPIYYSGWDYKITSNMTKGLSIQPELRVYLLKNKGFFVGAHAGLVWYNMTFGGDYRYQNTGWLRPTYGGGLGLGYRVNLGRNSGWKMEFAVGGGIYDAEYDKFFNEVNGPYAARKVRKLYYGFDQASIGLTYSINMRRGGRR